MDTHCPTLATRWGSTAIAQMTVTANTSQRSRVGVGMNRSEREGMPIYDYCTLENYYDKHHNHCLQA